MEFRRLGNSGLKVSNIGLGGNTFGGKWADEATSVKIIDRALDAGVNYIDTADTYTQGNSEEIIGRAVKGKRTSVIIASKFGHPAGLKPGQVGGSRQHMIKTFEGSLKRLNTDYIDLYYFHFPDSETPVEETLCALNDLVHAGKVRYIACSNFAGWQLCEAEWTARTHNLERFIAVQSRYNMLDRNIENEVVPCCLRYGIGVVPWGPLAGGFLTGKYKPGKMPEGVRLTVSSGIYRDVLTDAHYEKIAKFETFATERGHSIGELAIAWLLAKPWIGSVIAGNTSPEQLTANLKAADWKLTPDDLEKLKQML